MNIRKIISKNKNLKTRLWLEKIKRTRFYTPEYYVLVQKISKAHRVDSLRSNTAEKPVLEVGCLACKERQASLIGKSKDLQLL